MSAANEKNLQKSGRIYKILEGFTKSWKGWQATKEASPAPLPYLTTPAIAGIRFTTKGIKIGAYCCLSSQIHQG
jgi:hypothetical protein